MRITSYPLITADQFQKEENQSHEKFCSNHRTYLLPRDFSRLRRLHNEPPEPNKLIITAQNLSLERIKALIQNNRESSEKPIPLCIFYKVNEKELAFDNESKKIHISKIGKKYIGKFGEEADRSEPRYEIHINSNLRPPYYHELKTWDTPSISSACLSRSYVDPIKLFRNSLFQIARDASFGAKHIEWRICILWKKNLRVEQIANTLRERGFNLSIEKAFLTVDHSPEGKEWIINKHLSVQIPKGATVKDTDKEVRYRHYFSELSVHNYLVRRNKTKGSVKGLKEASTKPLDIFVKNIHEDLLFLASASPLVRLYAHNVHGIDNGDKKKLLSILMSSGFKVKLDRPYLDGPSYSTIKENILIKLPKQKVG